MHENNRSVNKLIFNKRVIVFSVFIPRKLCYWIGFEVEIILVYFLFMFYLELIEKMKKISLISHISHMENLSTEGITLTKVITKEVRNSRVTKLS